MNEHERAAWAAAYGAAFAAQCVERVNSGRGSSEGFLDAMERFAEEAMTIADIAVEQLRASR